MYLRFCYLAQKFQLDQQFTNSDSCCNLLPWNIIPPNKLLDGHDDYEYNRLLSVTWNPTEAAF